MSYQKFEHGKFKHAPDEQHYYDYVNMQYFKRCLPTVLVGYYTDPTMNKRGCYGGTIWLQGAKYASHIVLNPFFREWVDIIKLTILHEAIHVKLGVRYAHGKMFQKEKRRLVLLGAFDPYL